MDVWQTLTPQNTDWITFVFSINFLVFILLKVRFEHTFFSFIRLIDSLLFFSSHGDRFVLTNGWYYLSGFFTLSTFSLLATFWTQLHLPIEPYFIYFYFLFGSSAIVMLRSLFNSFLGYYLNFSQWVNQYQFRNATYIFRLSLLIYVGLLFYTYTFSFSPFFLQMMSYTVILVYLTYHVLLFKQTFDMIMANGVYFILYLCTLKLGPWFILINGLKSF